MADQLVVFNETNTLRNDAPNVAIAQREWMLAERGMVLGKYATRYTLEQRMGLTLRIIRTKRLKLPTVPLTQGVPPDSTGMVLENVDVTVEQWGIVVALTDVAMVTFQHPKLQKAIELKSLAITEMLEREMAKVLMGGTQVFFGDPVNNNSRDDLADAVSDRFTSALALRATIAMRTTGDYPISGNSYGGVIPPQVEGDLFDNDTLFQAATTRQSIAALEYGEIPGGDWMGVKWMRGNYLPYFKGVATPIDSGVTAERARFQLQASGGAINDTQVCKLVVVARDENTDYERKISQTATITMAGATGTTDGSILVTTPSSTNYVYDLYASAASGGDPHLWRSRVAASTAVTLVDFSDVSVSAASPPVAPASGIVTYVAWIFGKDAFMRVELNGMSLQSFMTPPGPSIPDPLAQMRKVGSKLMWKCAILDDNFMRRLEFTSGYPDGLPA